MNALSIDCAVSKLCIAAKKDNNTFKVCMNIGAKQSEKLLPTIDYVLKEIGLTSKELDYTAVTLGPGTFTGLRLGLSALKAINLAYNVPVYGVLSLDAYAYPYMKEKSTVISLIEAKEDEFFYSIYMNGNKSHGDDDKPLEDLLKDLDKEDKILASGPAAKLFVERTNELYPLYNVKCYYPENDCCDSLFEIAEDMIKNKKAPLSDLDGPVYVRKSEAEIVLEQKQNQKN